MFKDQQYDTSTIYDIQDYNIKIFDILIDRTNKIIKIVEDIEKLEELVQDEDIFKDPAIQITLDDFKEILPNYVVTNIVSAMINSDEYNYEPYIQHITRAILHNIDSLFIIYKDEDTISIESNFEYFLGGVEEWAAAVELVRQEEGWGASRGRQKGKAKQRTNKKGEPIEPSPDRPGEPTSGELSAILWQYKIYMPGREGASVQRWSRKSKSFVDVTERYTTKYSETILKRLAHIPIDKAPFWYLLEHGNSIRFDNAVGNKKYPIVSPTHVVQDMERELSKQFRLQLDINLDKIKKAFDENFKKYYETDWDTVDLKVDEWIDINKPDTVPSPNGPKYEKILPLGSGLNAYAYPGGIEQIRRKGQFTKGGRRVIGK
jgi:hypothetical protein